MADWDSFIKIMSEAGRTMGEGLQQKNQLKMQSYLDEQRAAREEAIWQRHFGQQTEAQIAAEGRAHDWDVQMAEKRAKLEEEAKVAEEERKSAIEASLGSYQFKVWREKIHNYAQFDPTGISAAIEKGTDQLVADLREGKTTKTLTPAQLKALDGMPPEMKGPVAETLAKNEQRQMALNSVQKDIDYKDWLMRQVRGGAFAYGSEQWWSNYWNLKKQRDETAPQEIEKLRTELGANLAYQKFLKKYGGPDWDPTKDARLHPKWSEYMAENPAEARVIDNLENQIKRQYGVIYEDNELINDLERMRPGYKEPPPPPERVPQPGEPDFMGPVQPAPGQEPPAKPTEHGVFGQVARGEWGKLKKVPHTVFDSVKDFVTHPGRTLDAMAHPEHYGLEKHAQVFDAGNLDDLTPLFQALTKEDAGKLYYIMDQDYYIRIGLPKEGETAPQVHIYKKVPKK